MELRVPAAALVALGRTPPALLAGASVVFVFGILFLIAYVEECGVVTFTSRGALGDAEEVSAT